MKNYNSEYKDYSKYIAIMISTDRSIFNEKSAVRARMIEYSKLYKELHIIIFSTKKYELIEISENLSIENMNKLKKVLKENHGSTRSVKLKLPNGQEMLLPIKIDLTSELEEQIGEILRVFEKNSV